MSLPKLAGSNRGLRGIRLLLSLAFGIHLLRKAVSAEDMESLNFFYRSHQQAAEVPGWRREQIQKKLALLIPSMKLQNCADLETVQASEGFPKNLPDLPANMQSVQVVFDAKNNSYIWYLRQLPRPEPDALTSNPEQGCAEVNQKFIGALQSELHRVGETASVDSTNSNLKQRWFIYWPETESDTLPPAHAEGESGYQHRLSTTDLPSLGDTFSQTQKYTEADLFKAFDKIYAKFSWEKEYAKDGVDDNSESFTTVDEKKAGSPTNLESDLGDLNKANGASSNDEAISSSSFEANQYAATASLIANIGSTESSIPSTAEINTGSVLGTRSAIQSTKLVQQSEQKREPVERWADRKLFENWLNSTREKLVGHILNAVQTGSRPRN